MKPILLLSALTCVADGAVAYAQEAQTNGERPNVLIVFTDDHRYDGVAALGNPDLKTPNLDSLVNNGVTFTNTFLQGANNGATSTPSRAQLITGKSVFEIPNGDGRFFPATMTSFATAFSEAGYNTFTTGKQNNGPEASMRGFQSGAKMFDLTKGFYKPHFYLPVQDFREDGKYSADHLYLVGGENQEFRVPVKMFYSQKGQEPKLKFEEFAGTHSNEVFGRAAEEFITNYHEEEPFLMYLAFHAPHDPRNAPQEYYDMYPPETLQLPVNYLPQHPFDTGEMEIRDEMLAPYPRTEENTKQQLCEYYALITHMDHQLGKVFEALRKRGMDKNTLIIFASDSGLGMGSHGLFGKQNLYNDAGIHVPFVLCGPNIPKNEKRSDLCYTYDIFPTLCDLTGVQIPASVTGKSMAASVPAQSEVGVRDELFFAYTNLERSVRDERYKLIVYCVNDDVHELLFDLQEDPNEMVNLANERKYGKILKRLRTRLIANKAIDAEWGNKFWETYLAK